jgi:CDGSH iron-sulfur domain-containing protein 3
MLRRTSPRIPRSCPRSLTHHRPTTPRQTSPRATADVVEIKVRENGPYKVTGPVRLIDADGNVFDLPDDGRPVALCRCGASKTKPFCDKTHSKIGFDAAERAVVESESEGS